MGAWLTFSHLFSLLSLSTCGWAWAWGTILETARLSQETQGGCQVEDQARGLLGASFQRGGHGPSPAPRPSLPHGGSASRPPVGSPEVSCTPQCPGAKHGPQRLGAESGLRGLGLPHAEVLRAPLLICSVYVFLFT